MIETVHLVREHPPRSDATLGWLYAPGFTLRTIELPWKENRRRESCIPPGKYRCTFLEASASGRYRRVYHVTDVPNRDGILIHPANRASELLGCIAPGMDEGTIGGERAVVSSRLALERFVAAMGARDFWLEVR